MARREDVDFGIVRARSFVGPVTGNVTGAVTLPTYTVAGLPAAASNSGELVHCSNGAGGSPCLAYSNGTNWLQIALDSAVSAT